MRFCQRQRDRGQVLIFAVIVATILLFMAFFLFDLQSMVRLRARSQHGVDAAVLSAAAWQGRSLNTIGELNLLKASLKLITDVDPTADDSLEGLLESVQLLSDMQVRISYAGPMIGVATAQQAAKNNGLRTTRNLYWALADPLRRVHRAGRRSTRRPTRPIRGMIGYRATRRCWSRP